jgi:FkbM family methyltransferase
MGKVLEEMLAKYCHDIKGVMHIGAHYGEEAEAFTRIGVENQMFFEPAPDTYDVLEKNVPGFPAYMFALGNVNNSMDFYMDETGGMSSSILKPKLICEHYPEITFSQPIRVPVRRLDSLIFDGLINGNLYDFINMDVQGYELEVLKGAVQFLEYQARYVYCEISKIELYEGCCMARDVALYLKEYGFTCKYTDGFNEHGWGDAFYAKEPT